MTLPALAHRRMAWQNRSSQEERQMQVDRRTFVAGSVVGAFAASSALAQDSGGAITAALTPFVRGYLAVQNAPGLILGIADRSGWSETAAFGIADLDTRRPIRPDERFHIGSITKSFTALMILQLVDEGKVALDADITRYLPDLPLTTPFGPVTVHHLLCHASGLQSEAPAIGWPDQRVEQAYAPGTRFHYCNMGYAWLGRIIVAQGGEDWSQALRRRVLDPLGMTQTSPVIGAGMRRWQVPSYVRREDDRPFPRRGALTRAGPETFTAASGCIASTAGDMAKYMACLARRGEGPKGRLLSAERFDLMVKRHIAADEFGPGGGYGYGWMTAEVEGRPVIRHTGGMQSFMSSIHVDLEAGCGAFASINAQQNYRPVPVTAQALRLCRARAKGAPPSKVPAFPDADLKLADYAGDYGDGVRVAVAGRALSLSIDDRTVTLEPVGDDAFACADPKFRLFTFLFRRAKPVSEVPEDKPNPVQTLEWARDTWVRRGATSPTLPEPDRAKLSPSELQAHEGLYVADGGWLTCVRVVARAGRLWVDSFDGVTPLATLGDGRFRFADESSNPEVAAFSPPSISPKTLSFAGGAFVRVGDPFMALD